MLWELLEEHQTSGLVLGLPSLWEHSVWGKHSQMEGSSSAGLLGTLQETWGPQEEPPA